MKFLAYTHANPLIQGSGGEKCLQGFLEKLAEKGNDVYCYCSNENKWKGKKVKDVFYDHLKTRTLDEILDEIKPDYVVTQFFNSKDAIRKAFAEAHGVTKDVPFLVASNGAPRANPRSRASATRMTRYTFRRTSGIARSAMRKSAADEAY